jgi:hypothetical protein
MALKHRACTLLSMQNAAAVYQTVPASGLPYQE